MHQFRSKSTILRFKAASLLLCLRCLLAPLASITLLYAVFQDDRKLAHVGIGLGVAAVVSTLSQWILAARARCPLCQTPVLASKDCAKHRRARSFLGSYRLRVALSILFKGTFHCPYCSEKSAMTVRRRVL
jgi:hypothetical protein